ncbi:DUF4259 domain-containing protein [Catenuloplanes indicus]|uniref:DUF4259 domain-containing protein n=1 Tax=Catenuloplanes indicus TaxID=137267 RepID=A0AAE3W6P3_9ACTN|nr:DUF4259 domain-containing protein [Catenuloplanes indicus]MDQ0370933.1 hypothetical protein [Catenuloplanes indicus]
MGAWGPGPLDNDTALDWQDALLRAATPADRAVVIRDALAAATTTGYLDYDLAAEAIVAALVVAASMPGGQALRSSAGLPEEADGIPVAAGTPALALRALDRIVADDSEWRALWSDSPQLYAEALASLREIREPLEAG